MTTVVVSSSSAVTESAVGSMGMRALRLAFMRRPLESRGSHPRFLLYIYMRTAVGYDTAIFVCAVPREEREKRNRYMYSYANLRTGTSTFRVPEPVRQPSKVPVLHVPHRYVNLPSICTGILDLVHVVQYPDLDVLACTRLQLGAALR